MVKALAFIAIALLALCGVWLWLRFRKYAERRLLEHERAAALVAEATKAAKQRGSIAGTGQNSA